MNSLAKAIVVVGLMVATAGCHRNLGVDPTFPTQAITVAVSGSVTDQDGIAVGGATVSAMGTTNVAGISDAAGRFSLNVDVNPGENVIVTAVKNEYSSAAKAVRATSGTIEVTLALTGNPPLLLDDGSITATLYPTDPGSFVGDPYDSDYATNARLIRYQTGDTETVLELGWAHLGNAALKMWGQGGAVVSQADGDLQIIRLPANSAGVLIVGQPSAACRLSQAVTFTVETRKAGGYSTPPILAR